MPLIIPTNSISDLGYNVDNSLRFDDGSSDYLTRTPASDGNLTTWTFSGWFKRSDINGAMSILGSAINGENQDLIQFQSDGTLRWWNLESNAYVGQLKTTRVFRDPSAWYHIVFIWDSSNATADNRMRIYVNGIQETVFTTRLNPPLNSTSLFNTADALAIGRAEADIGTYPYFSGYMAEVVFIDGTALDPTSFGEFDEDTGIWKPIDVSGLTFGTNGFYLDFENSGSLGADVSGNGNNFTVNNLTSIDQTTDTPTNNFATLNPLVVSTASSMGFSLSEGNLKVTPTTLYYEVVSTLAVSSGKWYWEAKMITSISNENTPSMGVTDINKANFTEYLYLNNPGTCYTYGATGIKTSDINGSTSNTSYGDTFSQNDIIGCALDLDNGFIYFSKNGTWQNSGDPESGATGTGSAFSSVSGNFTSLVRDYSAGNTPEWQYNFGNPPFTISSGNSDANGYGNFEYSVPSGYYALNTKNLAEYG